MRRCSNQWLSRYEINNLLCENAFIDRITIGVFYKSAARAQWVLTEGSKFRFLIF